MSLNPFPREVLTKIKHFYKFQYLVEPTTFETIFKRLNLEKTYGDCHDLKVLDLYPGPAQQSIVFNNMYKPNQHLLVDNRPAFVKHLEKELKDTPLEVSTLNPYDWETYLTLTEGTKEFLPEKQKRNHIHNKFLLMANLSDKKHEGLLMQWYNCIGQKNWIQRFGRVKMLLWMPSVTAAKLLALPNTRLRNKCSIVAETFTNSKLVALTDDKESSKIDKKILHKHDPIMISPTQTLPNASEISMALMEVDPLNFTIEKTNWDYVTKNLMILRKTPFIDAVESLGHGARAYFSQEIDDKDFLQRCPNSFSADEFIYISKLFAQWAFKPDINMDFYDTHQDE